MNPLVSIIVPSYQQARFLRVAIDSILSQGYEPMEILVLDGGSTDGSVEILQSYGDRIWFRSAPDGGQCQAINEGFQMSRGEIVAGSQPVGDALRRLFEVPLPPEESPVDDLLRAPLGNHLVLINGHHLERLDSWCREFGDFHIRP